MTLASDRENLKLDLLAKAGLSDAERYPLPGDASTRRYERIIATDGRRFMLMDQPPAFESQPCDPSWSAEERHAKGWNAIARLSAGRIEAFVAVAEHLNSLGLSAPAIPVLDVEHGLALIEDFGDDLFARVIEQGADEAPLYLAAIEALVTLHEAGTPPANLTGSAGDWPMLVYDEVALQGGADLFVEWLPKYDSRVAFDDAAIAEWRTAWAPVVKAGAEGASVMAHRDYHAENLIWLAERSGGARVGMIDFQDAVIAHPSWDLHSLLQDARRDVSPALEAKALEHYFTLRPSVDRATFMASYAGLAALNEARIIGIFARLIARDGKPRYAQFLPRMWAHLNRNLEQPALASVAAWFDKYVPAEVRQ